MCQILLNNFIFYQPLIDALVLEGGRAVGVPCFDLPPQPGCISESPFAIRAQQIMNEFAGNFKINTTDIMWPTERFYPHDYIPRISVDSQGVIQMGTVTEQCYLDDKA